MTDNTNRARWRAGFFILLSLWGLTVLGAGYALLDHGVTDTYGAVGREYMTRDLGVALRLMPALSAGTRRDDVLASLRRLNPTALISATDTTVGIEQLTFRFDRAGRLIAVDQPDLSDR
jgi:hypothetical protein